MDKHIFTTNGLKATKWDTDTVKAQFLNELANLMRSGFKESKFTNRLYRRLSMTFGHIAHYNRNGFYGEWFETPAKQLEWIQNALQYGCYGEPEYTYSDAERQFQQWLQSDEGKALTDKIAERAQRDDISSAQAMKAQAEATLARYGV